MLKDMRFGKKSLGPGDQLPKVDLATTSDDRFLFGVERLRRPILLITGSVTCPMTSASMSSLSELHEKYGEQVEFVTLNVREAHPAENFPQPTTSEEKLEHARALKQQFEIPWSVAVDDLDGELHQALGAKPNSAHIISEEGRILYRSLFAGDTGSLREALHSVSVGTAPMKRQSTAMMGPFKSAVGHVSDIMNLAGTQAWRDLWLSAPPMAIMGKLSARFKRDKRGRSHVATKAVVGMTALLAAGVVLRMLVGVSA
jgi:hypothetical protein